MVTNGTASCMKATALAGIVPYMLVKIKHDLLVDSMQEIVTLKVSNSLHTAGIVQFFSTLELFLGCLWV